VLELGRECLGLGEDIALGIGRLEGCGAGGGGLRDWVRSCRGRTQTYIARVARWAAMGLKVLEARWSSAVYLRIRLKLKIFRVSEPAKLWVKIKNRTRNSQTKNPQIPAPNPIHCHPYA